MKDALHLKYQQIVGQLKLIEDMERSGVDLSKIEVDNLEGV